MKHFFNVWFVIKLNKEIKFQPFDFSSGDKKVAEVGICFSLKSYPS